MRREEAIAAARRAYEKRGERPMGASVREGVYWERGPVVLVDAPWLIPEGEGIEARVPDWDRAIVDVPEPWADADFKGSWRDRPLDHRWFWPLHGGAAR